MNLRLLAAFFAGALVCLADVTGHWSGTFTFTSQDGEQRTADVYLILKQEGGKITGTGGRDLADRHEITSGTIEGDVISIEVEAGPSPVRLKLTVKGEELSGDVSRARSDGSTMTAKVAAKRVKDAK